jgi:hypothetical protein
MASTQNRKWDKKNHHSKRKPDGKAKDSGRTQNNALIKLDRRKQVANLYMQGKAAYQIAEQLDTCPATIRKDLRAIQKEWLSLAIVDFDAAKSKELAKIDHLEEIAWAAWERSCHDITTKSKRKESVRMSQPGPKGKPLPAKLVPLKVVEDVQRKGKSGDPRFLDKITWCIETRLKLLGLLQVEEKKTTLVIDWDAVLNAPVVDPLQAKIKEADAKLLPKPADEPDGEVITVNPAPQPVPSTTDDTLPNPWHVSTSDN